MISLPSIAIPFSFVGFDETQWQRLASLDFVAVSVVLTASMMYV
jgi:hypothetical protein